MTELTPGKRAELRALTKVMRRVRRVTMWSYELAALLDAADERDRLAVAVERVRALHESEPFEMPNGDIWYRCGRCQHVSKHPCPTIRALDGTDETTMLCQVERVRELDDPERKHKGHFIQTDIDRGPDGSAWSWDTKICHCDRPWRHA